MFFTFHTYGKYGILCLVNICVNKNSNNKLAERFNDLTEPFILANFLIYFLAFFYFLRISFNLILKSNIENDRKEPCFDSLTLLLLKLIVIKRTRNILEFCYLCKK